MKTQLSFGLWDHATFGPLAAVVPMAASIIGGGLLSKAMAPKAPKAATATSAPQPPRPPQSFITGGSSLFGSQAGSMGGTFLTGRASSAPSLGSSGGKKSLLGQ